MKQNYLIFIFSSMIFLGASAQVGINTSSPNPSAALDVTSNANDKGFLPPRLTTLQRDAISSPAEGLTIYNTTVKCLQWYNGTYWYDGCNTSSLISSYPTVSIFCASGPTAIINVTNPITGKIWMDRNLGASQVATSSVDVKAYGDIYQWGRRSDGHQCLTSPITITLSSTDQPTHDNFIRNANSPFDWRSPQNINLWQGVNGVNNPCPSGYRLPSESELDAERTSWSSNNAAGAFASPTKLLRAGGRDGSLGSLVQVGTVGNYWSSTVSSTDSRMLYFSASQAFTTSSVRSYGRSVRCLKN